MIVWLFGCLVYCQLVDLSTNIYVYATFFILTNQLSTHPTNQLRIQPTNQLRNQPVPHPTNQLRNQQTINTMPGCFELLDMVGHDGGNAVLFNNLNTNIDSKRIDFPARHHHHQRHHLDNLANKTGVFLDLRDSRFDVITKIVCSRPFRVSCPAGRFGGCDLEQSVTQNGPDGPDGLHVVTFARGLPLDPRPYCLVNATTDQTNHTNQPDHIGQPGCYFIVSGVAYDDESLRELAALPSKNVFVQLSWTLAAIRCAVWLGVFFNRSDDKLFFPPGWPGETGHDVGDFAQHAGARHYTTWQTAFADHLDQPHQSDKFPAQFSPASKSSR
jgi:hypothetical protein